MAMAEATFDLAIEAGRFSTARTVCDLILSRQLENSNTITFRARRQLADAIENAWTQQTNHSLEDANDKKLRETRLRWQGQTRSLGEILRLIEREKPKTGIYHQDRSWPVFGGHVSRDGAGSFVFDRTANLWRFREFHRAGIQPGEGQTESTGLRQAIESGRLLNLFPISAHDLLFFHDARNVWAVHGRSGRLAWSHRTHQRSQESLDHNDSQKTNWYSPAYGNGMVYACLGNETVSYYGYETSSGTSTIVALNATTGKPIWRKTPQEFAPSLEKSRFGSAPLFWEGSLYVIARRQRTFGFEDCYLLRLDARDGKLSWFAHLGSASTGGFSYKRPTFAIPTLIEGTIYVTTNLGTIAAISAQTGLVEWLRVYERASESTWRDISQSGSAEVMPWHFNPILHDGDLLACKPLDTVGVAIIERSTGHTIRTIESSTIGTSPSLLSFRDGKLFGVGQKVFCIDARTDEEVWSAAMCDDDDVMGRGIATETHLLVPGRRSLCGFDLKTGARIANPWESEDTPGNLTPFGDQIIVAGVGQVSALGRKADVWAHLHAEMAAREWDPAPALDLAEIAFRSDDYVETAKIMEVAIQRIEAYSDLIDERLYDRMFDDCMWFARDWPRRNSDDRTQILTFFNWASQSARTTGAHMAVRFALAEHYSETKDFKKSVQQYQQILNDQSMRRAVVGNSKFGRMASVVAWQRINDHIKRHGRDVYRDFDNEASEWLEAAKRENTLSLLDRIIATRPNARCITDALIQRGRLLADQGRLLPAARSFANAWEFADDVSKKAAIVQSIATAFANAGCYSSAFNWLTKAHRENPQARVKDENGRRISLLALRDQLVPELTTPYKPTIPNDLTRKFELWFPDDITVLEPRLGKHTKPASAVVHIRGEGTLHAYDAANGDDLWEISLATTGQSLELLIATDQVHVFSTQHQILGIDTKTGKTVWSVGKKTGTLDDPMADPEWFPSYHSHASADDLLISIKEDGDATAIDITKGEIIWNRKLSARPSSPIIADGRVFACTTSSAEEPQIAIFNIADGLQRTAIPLNPNAHPVRFHITPDERLIVVYAQGISAFAIENSELLWQSSLAGHVTESSIQFDVDGLYLTDDGEQIRKIGYAHGLVMWESEPLNDLAIHGGSSVLHDGQLILMTDRSMVGIDTIDGGTLWQATLPHGNTYVFQAITASDIIAIEASVHDLPAEYVLQRIDHRRANGLVNQGSILLGEQENVQGFALRDGAILIIRDQMVSGLGSTQTSKP